MSYSTGLTSVTGSVTTVPPAFRTLTWQSSTTSANSAITFTVAANRRWTVKYIRIMGTATGANVNTNTLTVKGVVMGAVTASSTATTSADSSAIYQFDTYETCPVLAAGETISLSTAGAYSHGLDIGYYEEVV